MKKIRGNVALVIASLFLAWSAACVFGQTASTATNTAGVVKPAQEEMTLLKMWEVGGPVMWPIGLTSIAGLALAVYGFLNMRTDKMLRPDLVPQLQDAINNLNINDALTLCNGNPAYMTNVLGAGLQRISDGIVDVSSMERAMEEAAIEEVNEGMKPLNNLSVCAQIAPMLGLLGTVTGMIGAFNKIGMGAMGDPEQLAGDIGEAMITTAAGLIVAIPGMFAYFYLKGQYNSNVAKGARVIGNLLHHLVVTSRRVESGGSGEAKT